MNDQHPVDEERLNPGHRGVRDTLRIVGPFVLIVGAIFMAVGLIDFFSSMAPGRGFPTKFWCCFVGMPLFGLGMAMSKVAFMGKMARYVAAETSPVAKDTFNYMASETQEGVRDVASAIREGLVGEESTKQIHCSTCNAANDCNAKFCDSCGSQISGEKDCCACGVPNDFNAKFCDACGSTLKK